MTAGGTDGVFLDPPAEAGKVHEMAAGKTFGSDHFFPADCAYVVCFSQLFRGCVRDRVVECARGLCVGDVLVVGGLDADPNGADRVEDDEVDDGKGKPVEDKDVDVVCDRDEEEREVSAVLYEIKVVSHGLPHCVLHGAVCDEPGLEDDLERGNDDSQGLDDEEGKQVEPKGSGGDVCHDGEEECGAGVEPHEGSHGDVVVCRGKPPLERLKPLLGDHSEGPEGAQGSQPHQPEEELLGVVGGNSGNNNKLGHGVVPRIVPPLGQLVPRELAKGKP